MVNDNKADIIIAMLEEQKSLFKNTKSTQLGFTKIDNLAERKTLFNFHWYGIIISKISDLAILLFGASCIYDYLCRTK